MPAQYVGRTLGRYRVVEAIGAGGMGEVYRAHDEHLRRDVALKCLSGEAAADAAGRMRREAHALSKLNHPNIATVHDFGHEDGVDFVVMELIQGESLATKLRRGAIPFEGALIIARQIAAGLEEAHAHGVVHRDLKPGNVMVTTRGQVKIVDFGLAWQAPDLSSPTMTNVGAGPLMGTLPYMAPEQIRGGQADQRADIWALGVLLYEMVTRRLPFEGSNQLMTAERILNSEPEPVRALNAEVPGWLEGLIAAMLHKSPAQRVQSMREVSAALHASDTTGMIVAMQAARGGRRRRRRLAAGAVVLAAAATVGGWYLLRPAPAVAAVPLLVADPVNRTGDAAFDDTVIELLSTSLEQSRSVALYPRTRVAHVVGLMRRDPAAPIDDAVAREIVQREGLAGLVTSSVSQLGAAYVLVVGVEGAEGRSLGSSRQVFSNPGELPAQIDKAVAEVRSALGESRASIRTNATPLADVTSSSLDAVRLYTRGRQRLQAGDAEGAMALFRNALDLDPDFAMAHEYLGVAYTNVQDLASAEKHVARAVELADRLPAAERHKILGDYHMLRRDYDEACSHLQVLVELRPLDPTPLISLGWCKGLRYDFAGAVADTRRAVDMQPSPRARINLARLIFMGGGAEQALGLMNEVLRESPSLQGHFVAAQAAMVARRFEQAARHYEVLRNAGGNWGVEGRFGLADLALAHGRADEAVSELTEARGIARREGNAVAEAQAAVLLAELARDGGRPDDDERLLSTLDVGAQRVVRFLVARAHARAGRARAAGALLPDPAPEGWAAADRALVELIRAELALARGDAAGAVRAADAGWLLDRSVVVRETQARAYEAVGRGADAADAWREVLARAAERTDAIDKPGFHRVVEAERRLSRAGAPTPAI